MAAHDETHRPSESIEGLESRLRVLEQHLNDPRERSQCPDPAPSRLRDLRLDLQDLTEDSEAVANLLDLHRRYYGELSAPATTDAFGSPSASERLAIVNSCATLFPTTVSQLTSLEALPIPSSESLVALSKLTPRTVSAALSQSRQLEEVGELRSRTAALLQRWHASSVLAVGDCWAEWEERLMRIETAVRQAEAAAEAAKHP